MDATQAQGDRPMTAGPALVVAGMHRSGTSAMARVLSLAGATLPDRVIQPGPDNPLGFWEPWEMVALSDEILTNVGFAWDDVFVHAADAPAWDQREAFLSRARSFVANNFGGRPLPVVKDPRASVLTSLWRNALSDEGYRPTFIIMARHPLEVAQSLSTRDQFPIAKSMLLWTAYMVAVERDTRGLPRLFVSYPDLIADWRAVLDRIETVSEAPLPGRTPEAETEIDRYLSRSHRHHEASDEDLAVQGLLPVIETVHQWMQAAAAGLEPESHIMDEAQVFLDRLRTTLQPIQEGAREQALKREASLSADLADAEARLIRTQGRVREIELAATHRDAEAAKSVATLRSAVEAEAMRADELSVEAAAYVDQLRAAHLTLTALQVKLADQCETTARVEREHATLQEAMQARQSAYDHDTRARAELLNGLQNEVRTLRISAVDADRRVQISEAERAAQAAEIDRLSARIATMKAGVGWKIARPIRVIEGRLKRAKRPD